MQLGQRWEMGLMPPSGARGMRRGGQAGLVHPGVTMTMGEQSGQNPQGLRALHTLCLLTPPCHSLVWLVITFAVLQ